MITNDQLKQLSEVQPSIVIPFPFGFCKSAESVDEGFWEANGDWDKYEGPMFHYSVMDEEDPNEMDGDPDMGEDNFLELEEKVKEVLIDFGDGIDFNCMEITMEIYMSEFETNDPNEVWSVIKKRLEAVGGKMFPPDYLGG